MRHREHWRKNQGGWGAIAPPQSYDWGVGLTLWGLLFHLLPQSGLSYSWLWCILAPWCVDINNCHMWTQSSSHYWSVFTCDKLRVQNVLENALEKLSEGLKLQNFPGSMPPDPPSFRALHARKASLHLLTFSPPAQKRLPTPLSNSKVWIKIFSRQISFFNAFYMLT